MGTGCTVHVSAVDVCPCEGRVLAHLLAENLGSGLIGKLNQPRQIQQTLGVSCEATHAKNRNLTFPFSNVHVLETLSVPGWCLASGPGQ